MNEKVGKKIQIKLWAWLG